MEGKKEGRKKEGRKKRRGEGGRGASPTCYFMLFDKGFDILFTAYHAMAAEPILYEVVRHYIELRYHFLHCK